MPLIIIVYRLYSTSVYKYKTGPCRLSGLHMTNVALVQYNLFKDFTVYPFVIIFISSIQYESIKQVEFGRALHIARDGARGCTWPVTGRGVAFGAPSPRVPRRTAPQVAARGNRQPGSSSYLRAL